MARTLWDALGAIVDRRGRKGRQLALQGVLGIAFEYACAKNDIDHRLTKPKHPWTNGQVERMNWTLRMSCRTALLLWLPRLFMMTISPGRSVGSSTLST